MTLGESSPYGTSFRDARNLIGLCAALLLAACSPATSELAGEQVAGTVDTSAASSDPSEHGDLSSSASGEAPAGAEGASTSGSAEGGAPNPADGTSNLAIERVMSKGGIPLTILPPLVPGVAPDPEPGSPPRLEIDGLEGEHPVDDWGLIHPDGRTRRTYALRNHGATPLAISIAFAGCGCTQVRLGGAEIAPREAVTMSVTYQPERDEKAIGRTDVMKDVTIRSDDPLRPSYDLKVRVRFEPPGPARRSD